MNSWDLIRKTFCDDKQPGSLGYKAALNQAAILYMDLEINISDRVESSKAFEADEELTHALLMRGDLLDMGMVKHHNQEEPELTP